MNALDFLFKIILNLVTTIFIARVIFQWAAVNMNNPIAQFVLRFTQPVIMPLQKIFPTIKRFNFAGLAVTVLINIGFVFVYFFLAGADITASLIIGLGLRTLAQQILDFIFWSVIIQVVFSWLPNTGFHPLAQIVHTINSPLLGSIQRILPHVGGFDFAPIVVIVAIKFIEILLH